MSKTSQFNKALDEYFAKLKLDEKGGQWRTCRFSGEKFYVRPVDIEFYKRIRVPLPTLSPSERIRRRLAYAPGYEFFKVESALTGKPVITVYPPTTPFKIYEHKIWFSHEFDPMHFGTHYDVSRSFFDQWRKLQLAVPRPNLNTDFSNLNSDFTNNSIRLKNCYLTFDTTEGENLYYFECCFQNKDCVDCWACSFSDTCYQSWGEYLFKCFFVHNSEHCLESYFLYDCRNCEYCFMCANLRNKKYCFFNEQLTKEEYEKRTSAINLGNCDVLQKYLEKFQELKQNAIRKAVIEERAVNSYGSWIWDMKDCHYICYGMKCERVAYSLGVAEYKDSYDIVGGSKSELCYELVVIQSENNYGVKFSSFVNESLDLEYCDLCRNCHDCFGCVGLTNKSFCIFNKQYSEEEYWRKVDGIKTAMLEHGEYGEFFPPEFSPFPYNLSIVTSYPGYEDFEAAKQYNYQFITVEESEETSSLEVISSKDLPLDIKDVDDSVLGKAILDEEHNKKFRVTRYELEFYRKYRFSLPRVHPLVRMKQWRKNIMDLRLRFHERPCVKCGRVIPSIYAPDCHEKNVYCEDCYLKEIG